LQIYRVAEVNHYVRTILEDDPILSDLWLQGEVSNFTRATSGHLYFTLKDEHAQISCVMWRSSAGRQKYLPKGGEAIVAHGRISVYEVQGRYQFYVDEIQPAGIGLLHLEYERLRKKLEAEGLFAEEFKRPLPPFPRRIGVVTSRVGAAFRDILHVLERRFPLVEVLLAPTTVQGDEAPPQIVQAIDSLNRYGDLDLIIVARGGGSMEDLWAFNDETVARAIAASRVPVVSGVGHETDFTIADFVADVRAPTPSAAAEISVPDGRELIEHIRQQGERLTQVEQSTIAGLRDSLRQQADGLRRYSPSTRVAQHRLRLDELSRSALLHIGHRTSMEREKVNGLGARLNSLSPWGTLQRGYAVVSRRDSGELVRSVRQVVAGDGIEIRVQDGEFSGRVEERPKGPTYA